MQTTSGSRKLKSDLEATKWHALLQPHARTPAAVSKNAEGHPYPMHLSSNSNRLQVVPFYESLWTVQI